jgi:NADH dehydrogenase
MSERRKVVIVGGGFGGLSAAQHLNSNLVDVTLIDRRNYHLFQPLLYQVATGSLSPGEIASPLRSILSRQKNTRDIAGAIPSLVLTHDHDSTSTDSQAHCLETS